MRVWLRLMRQSLPHEGLSLSPPHMVHPQGADNPTVQTKLRGLTQLFHEVDLIDHELKSVMDLKYNYKVALAANPRCQALTPLSQSNNSFCLGHNA